jgi:photosystem II stability/assembly factor-like uncharacterized protein
VAGGAVGAQIALGGSLKDKGHIWGRREGRNHGGEEDDERERHEVHDILAHCSQTLTAGDRSHLMGDHGGRWAHLREKKEKKRGGRG